MRIARTFCFTNEGQALYLVSPTEIQRLTYSQEMCDNLQVGQAHLYVNIGHGCKKRERHLKAKMLLDQTINMPSLEHVLNICSSLWSYQVLVWFQIYTEKKKKKRVGGRMWRSYISMVLLTLLFGVFFCLWRIFWKIIKILLQGCEYMYTQKLSIQFREFMDFFWRKISCDYEPYKIHTCPVG